MTAYYNEVDPYAAEWLRNLISAGHIAPGDVDERDLRDVRPSDLDGYRQCHFFAGIGIWSAALRAAGWDDDRPVWTGSCPCQPFSAAGAGAGFEDERHLWPDWHWLIEQCRPEIVFGEQVASADGLGWLDLVSADMEATDYALGAVDTCAAGFRSFHIRQRLYFAAEDQRSADREAWRDVVRAFGGMGDSGGARSAAGLSETLGTSQGNTEVFDDRSDRLPRPIEGRPVSGRVDHAAGPRHQPQGQGAEGPARDETRLRGSERGRGADRLADAAHVGCREERADDGRRGSRDCPEGRPAGRGAGGQLERVGHTSGEPGERNTRGLSGKKEATASARDRDGRHGDGHPDAGPSGRLADADGGHACAEREQSSGKLGLQSQGSGGGLPWFIRDQPALLPDAPDLYWRDADWLFCRDGVWRPVGPGTFPLATAAAARMGRLRAYGNGLDLAQAAGFVRAFLDRDVTETPAIAGDLFEWGT